MNRLLVILLLVGFGCIEKPNQSYEFLGTWEFKNQTDSVWRSASVPGAIHQDLLHSEMIENPLENNNEQLVQWVENENWGYRTKWEVSSDLLSNDNVELIFNGLDTYASVYLNKSLILEANNMFRTWKVDVKNLLKKGENDLRISFTSPISFNKDHVLNYPYQLPSGNETVDLKVSSFTRKAAYQFGWDWGPRLVSLGIWRPIQINTWNEARIEDVFVSTKVIKDEEALIEVQVTLASNIEKEYELLLNGERHQIELKKGQNIFLFPIIVQNPKLWWPNGHGDQILYDMKVELMNDQKQLDQQLQTYGIRTVELVNEPDSIGTSYYFKVNGQSIFMKGANYIPQDMFPSSVSNQQYRDLIAKVKEANMNMLRVWGGGIYESDLFYNLCDQNGILVWQDLMFAGSMYPSDSNFHSNVKEEVEDNIIRLRSHPSIALWCGNNEIEVAWHNWGWQDQFGYSSKDSTEIWENYLQIFHNEIPDLIAELTPDLAYVTTSPLSNWGTPENFNHSSMHYWGVWHGNEPLENYRSNVGRFMSEYGFQSFPSYSSLASVIDSSDLRLNSDAMANRQKSYIGNEMITQISSRHFGEAADFEEYILKSQQTQALAMKMAIQSHRLNKPRCMGTLFWQLNDVWQGPSWSVLEYDGTPKLAYEEIMKWYQSIVVIPKLNKRSIDFYIVSDRLEPVSLRLKVKYADQFYEQEVYLESNENLKAISFDKTGEYSIQLLENGTVIFKDSTTF